MNPWVLFLVCATIIAISTILIVSHFSRKKNIYLANRTQFGQIPVFSSTRIPQNYWEIYKTSSQENKNIYQIDDLTWDNLDMLEVFQRINACKSEIGDIYLYKQLHKGNASLNETELQEHLISLFRANHSLMYNIQYHLSLLGKNNVDTVSTITLNPHALNQQYKWVVYTLAILPLLSFLLLLWGFQAFFIGFALTLCVNFITSYFFKAQNSSYNILYPVSSTVACARKLANLLLPHNSTLANQILKDCNKCKKINWQLAVMRSSDIARENALPDPLGFFQFPLLAYYSARKFVVKHSSVFANLYASIGQIDSAASIYSFRESLPYFCSPTFDTSHKLGTNQLYHPLLQTAVPNSINTNRGILLTGSNASGKSTFIKAIAVNCLLGQTIHTCCAHSLAYPKSQILSSMAVSDSIIEGDSYFVAEIKSLKRLVEAVNRKEPCLLFIDEILKGTNTIERIGAAYSFLQYFAKTNALCFTASHDIELVDMVQNNYNNYHFSETIQDNQVLFLYKLMEGPATSRNALKLLEIQNFPTEIMTTATSAVQAFESSGHWLAQ